MVRVYYTVDTEYQISFTRNHGVDTREANFARSITGRTPAGDVGIFYQMDMLEAHGHKGVFFIDPMPAMLWGTGAIADIVEPIVTRGHDAQLHLHTEWLGLAGDANPLGPKNGKKVTGINLKDFTYDQQCELLEYARDQLEAAGAPRPFAFRAGNYGANDDSLRALAQLGLTYDSSHAPGLPNSPCAISLGPEHRRPLAQHGITEVPIACGADWRDGLRHGQLSAMSFAEMRAAIHHAKHNDIPNVVLVAHSFELLSRDRSKINRIVKRRFDQLCALVEEMDGVEAATFASHAPQICASSQPQAIGKASLTRWAMRMGEQALSNYRYGRW